MKNRILSFLVVALMFVPVIAFAKDGDVVHVSIHKGQTSSSSKVINHAKNYMEYEFFNHSSSERGLYGNCYVFIGLGQYREVNYKRADPGRDSSYRWHISGDGGQAHYYFELDPVGVGTKGCAGAGSLYD